MTLLVLTLIALFGIQDTPAIRGLVIDDGTKQPIAGASVILVRPDALAAAIVVSTDAVGRFAFEKVPPGTYRILAEHDDYVRSAVSEPIEVGSGDSVTNPTLTLTASAVISGRVIDEQGAPVSKIVVKALAGAVVAGQTRTNDLGEYRLFGLPPGAYIVSATRYPGPSIEGNFVQTPTPPCPDCPGEGTMRQSLTGLLASGSFIDPRALTGQTYPEVFYPGTTERAAATPVKAGPGARIDGIDLQLVVR